LSADISLYLFYMLKISTLTLLLIGGCLSVARAQTSWTLGSAVRKESPTDTLRGWFRYDDQVHFQPLAGGAQQVIPPQSIERLLTERGELFVPTPAALASATSSGLMSQVVSGQVSLLHDEASKQKTYFLLMPGGQVAELSRLTFLQQIQNALPGCPVTSTDSLTIKAKKLRYQARYLGPLVVRYNRCRYPTAATSMVRLHAAARLTGGLRAGLQSYQLAYQRTGQLQDTDFGSHTSATAGAFLRLTFNQRFYLQPELNYQQLTGDGTVSIPTNSALYNRYSTSHLNRQLAVGNLLARYHVGLPAEGKWRPILLGGLSAGYAFKSEYTVNSALVYTDGTQKYESAEPTSAAKWSSGYVAGLGVEAPLWHRPTLEARYYASYFDVTGIIKRDVKAEILELQLAWSW
jgi:opacity protein-like surface antigen